MRKSLVVGLGLVAFGVSVAAVPAAGQQLIATDPVEAVMIGSDNHPMPLVEERLTVAVDGQHATTTLLQVWRNKTSGTVEGRYKLRAGEGARVEGFAYWNGEDKIVGEVFEKATAHAIYDQTVSRRRDPGLLDQEGEGQFGFKVFPIAPDERKRVEIRWNRWLPRHGNKVRYRAPQMYTDAEIVISVEAGAKVKSLSSPTHDLAVEKLKSGGVRVRSKGLKADRRVGELVLDWEVDEKPWTPSAYVHSDGENDGYFALALPAPSVIEGTTAKDVTIVLDRSGSMAGAPLANAKAAAIDVVKRLGKKDRVNVIVFSDEVDPLFSQPQPLDDGNREQAIGFIQRLREGGGTDIALALNEAFKTQDDDKDRPRIVIFMTDGQSDAKAAMDAAQADTRDVRVFTVGLGEGVAKPLLSRLAAVKRGRFTYIETADDIREDVATLYAQISRPLLVGISLEVEGAHVVRTYPRSLSDVFADDQLLVTGRLRGKGTITFALKGKLAGHDVKYATTVKVGGAISRPWVGRLWAQSRVDHLLEEISLAGEKSELKDEVLELALAYNFVTPYTSFLAIPESELTAQTKQMIEDARARREDAIDRQGDVDGKSGGGGQVIVLQEKAPTIDASTTKQGAVVRRDYVKNVPAPPRTHADTMNGAPGAQADAADYGGDEESDDKDSRSHAGESMAVQQKRGGCAGCVVTSGDGLPLGPALLVSLALALFVLVSRRRGR